MNTNSRYSGQKLFFRHIAVPNGTPIDQRRAAAINLSATQTVELIKNLPNKSRAAISSELTKENDLLKKALNTPPKLAGELRRSAKRLWAEAVLGQFDTSPTRLSPCKFNITELNPEMVNRIFESFAQVYFESSQDTSLCRELLAADVHIRLKELLVGDAADMAKEFAAGALSNLSRKEAHCQKLLAASVHTQLVALLNSNATEKAKEYAAMTLCNLSFNEASRDTLVKAGVQHQLGALLSGDATDKAKEYAARTLCNLSRNEADCQELLAADVHTQLVALLRGNATEKAKEFAAETLMNLSFNAAHRETLVAAGVHTRLGVLLRRGATQKATEFAAGAVMNLSFNEANRETLVKANVHTQLGALLSRGATPTKAEKWAALLLDPKAPAGEKEKAATALYELSFDDASCQALLAAGVHTQLAAFLKGNDAKDEATALARCTRYNLSSNAANRPRLFGAGDHKKLDALLSGGATPTAKEWAALLRDPKATSGDKEGAAEALYNLSFVEASREALLAEGVDTQLAALRLDDRATPHAREWAGMAWRHLNPLKVDFLDLMDAGVREHLRACLSDGVTQKATEYAAIALCWLSLSDDNHLALFAAGVHEQLNALRMGDATDKAKEFAAGALENLGDAQ